MQYQTRMRPVLLYFKNFLSLSAAEYSECLRDWLIHAIRKLEGVDVGGHVLGSGVRLQHQQ